MEVTCLNPDSAALHLALLTSLPRVPSHPEGSLNAIQYAGCERYNDLNLGPRAIYGVVGWTESYLQTKEVDKMT